MGIVRVVLLLTLSIIGGILGFQFGTWYTSEIQWIATLLKDNELLVNMSIGGFSLIGVLLGVLAYSRASQQLTILVEGLKEMPANDKLAVFFGAFTGLLFTLLLYPLFSNLDKVVESRLPFGVMITLALGFVLVFVGIQASLSMKAELRKLLPNPEAAEGLGPDRPRILDTNIVIDGRIQDIVRSGFLDGTLYVPGFVLDELHMIADSSDALKRNRGRRGLEILNQIQREHPVVVRIYDHLVDLDPKDPVDHKLVVTAKALKGSLVTNDYNLNQVASLQGVPVLNVNELANALRPVVLPGEQMEVNIIKEGREPGQGVAYLDDGTMIVVEDGRGHIGETVTVSAGTVLQTVAGKMIFAKMADVAQAEDEERHRKVRQYSDSVGRPRGNRRQSTAQAWTCSCGSENVADAIKCGKCGHGRPELAG